MSHNVEALLLLSQVDHLVKYLNEPDGRITEYLITYGQIAIQRLLRLDLRTGKLSVEIDNRDWKFNNAYPRWQLVDPDYSDLDTFNGLVEIHKRLYEKAREHMHDELVTRALAAEGIVTLKNMHVEIDRNQPH